MSLTNAIGLLLCLGGIILHVVHKATAPQTVVPLPKHRDDATARFLYDDVSSCEEEQESNDDDSEVAVCFFLISVVQGLREMIFKQSRVQKIQKLVFALPSSAIFLVLGTLGG